MKLFFDTSALVKFFHEEKGSSKVTELIISKDNEIWISELAKVEFISAVFRRLRSNEIDDAQLNKALSGFDEQLSEFNIEPLGQAVIKEAEALIKKYGKVLGLRTLDALHLSTFSLISESDWVFVAADENLCKTVKLLGCNFLNPLTV